MTRIQIQRVEWKFHWLSESKHQPQSWSTLFCSIQLFFLVAFEENFGTFSVSFIFLDILTLLTTFLTSSMTTSGLSDTVLPEASFPSSLVTRLVLVSLTDFVLLTVFLISPLIGADLLGVGMVSKLDERTSGSDKMSAKVDLLLSLTGALWTRPLAILRLELDFDELWELEDGQRDSSGFVEQDDNDDELCCLQNNTIMITSNLRATTYLLFTELLLVNVCLGGPEIDFLDADLKYVK